MNNLRVTVYCAASIDVDEFYINEAYRLGRQIAESHREIIYGGGHIGLMGKVADGANSVGGKVIGVIPEFLENLELGHKSITELRKVKDMHERQAMMLKETDCVVALPGGCGTFLELLEAITWKRLGLITVPIIIVNLKGYFSPLVEMLNKAIDEGFMRNEYLALWKEAATVDEAMEMINNLLPSPVHDVI